MTIRPVGAELFHADGRTDRHDEANRRSSHFASDPKNYVLRSYLDSLLVLKYNTKEVLLMPKGSSQHACLFCFCVCVSACDLLNNSVNKYSITTEPVAGEQNMSKEHWQGKTEVFAEKPVLVALCFT